VDAQGTPLNRSFMHLHVGFDGVGLEGLEMHHIVVNSWQGGVDAEQARSSSCLPWQNPPCQLSSLLLGCMLRN
jgi:hypothetical protein